MYGRETEPVEELACRCGEPACPRCNPVGIVHLKASPRTRNRFLAGFIFGTALNLIVPVLIPVSVLGSVSAALFFRLSPAPVMIGGSAALAVFWLWPLPDQVQGSSDPRFLFSLLFVGLIYLYLTRPGRICARELIFRGRGLLAGWIMSSTLVAMALSAAAALIAAFG